MFLHWRKRNWRKIKEGMIFTIEPINQGKYEQNFKDGWTAVTKDKTLSAGLNIQ